MRLLATLEAGRQDVLDAVSNLSFEQASLRAVPGCWSIVECLEHVVIVEERYLDWLLNGTFIDARRDADKEMRLFTIMRSRLTRVEAPAVFLPQARFETLTDATAAFAATRDRTVALVRERGEAIYSIGAEHPYFGRVNGAELLELMDAHARRHAEQIRDIRELARV